MSEAVVAQQIDQIQKDPENQFLFHSTSFNAILGKMRMNDPLAVKDFEELLKDESRLSLTLGLLAKYKEVIFTCTTDLVKSYLVKVLHEMYFSRRVEDCAEQIKFFIVEIAKEISSPDLRNEALLQIREILDEDPCCIEFRTAVENVIRINDPSFRWSNI